MCALKTLKYSLKIIEKFPLIYHGFNLVELIAIIFQRQPIKSHLNLVIIINNKMLIISNGTECIECLLHKQIIIFKSLIAFISNK